MRSLFLLAVLWGSAGANLLAQSAPAIDTLRFTSSLLGNTRLLRVWLPPGYHDEGNREVRYPVLYLHDGQAVFRNGNGGASWEAEVAALRLIRAGVIRPIIIVGIDNMGRLRAHEYLPYRPEHAPAEAPDPVGERYARSVIEEIVPLIDGRFRTMASPEGRALGGASFGGLITLYTAARHGGTFSRYIVESASIWVADRSVLADVAAASWHGESFFVGVGTNEANRPGCTPLWRENDMVTNTRDAVSRLVLHGVPEDHLRLVVEPCATHDVGSWARRLPEALVFLWPATGDDGR